MISNAEIKRIKSLAQKKFRDESGLFIVEGEKLVDEALRSSFKVESVYRIEDIGEEAMSRISALNSPSPALAVVRKSDVSTPSVPANGLYIGLDAIRDPGNMGTIIRIADWFGVQGIYASRDSVDIYNPKTVQATMGAIFRIPVYHVDMVEAIKAFPGTVYGTFLDGVNIYSSDLKTGVDSPVMVMIGNEANGISKEVSALIKDRLFIPPYPADTRSSESLNAAIATAVAIAEFRRRI